MELVRIMSKGLKLPFFRFSPKLDYILKLNEKSSAKIIDAWIDTLIYMYEGENIIDKNMKESEKVFNKVSELVYLMNY